MGEPRSSSQIAVALDIDIVSVCHLLKRIIKQVGTDIKFVELDRNSAAGILGDSTLRRTRFFFFEGITLGDPFQEFLEQAHPD